MPLTGSLLGYTVAPRLAPSQATSVFDTVKVYATTHSCIIDKIRVRNTVLTEEEVFALKPYEDFDWLPDVVMYADFENNLSAGNVTGLTNPIEKWLLFRKQVQENTFKSLGEFDVSIIEFIDYEIKNNKSYLYRLFAQSSDEVSAPLDADILQTDFNKWSLIDMNTKEVWLLSLDVQSGTQERKEHMTVYDGSFGEFPYESYSLNNYEESSVTITGGRISSNGSFIYPQDYIDTFKDFINNGNRKILKDRRGRGWIVGTTRPTSNYVDDSREQLVSLTFSYTQVAELES